MVPFSWVSNGCYSSWIYGGSGISAVRVLRRVLWVFNAGVLLDVDLLALCWPGG